MIKVMYILLSPLTEEEIRECVFLSLDQRFDPHLAQAENLTTLFVAMHDGVRERGREHLTLQLP